MALTKGRVWNVYLRSRSAARSRAELRFTIISAPSNGGRGRFAPYAKCMSRNVGFNIVDNKLKLSVNFRFSSRVGIVLVLVVDCELRWRMYHRQWSLKLPS
eukprot:4422867-Amphidinium_carterae.1